MRRVILSVALALAIVPVFAHKVRVDFDHGAQFSRYKTYRIVQAANPSSPNPAFPNQLLLNRIGGFIEEALAAKGMKHTASGEYLQISYGIRVIEQPTFTTFSNGWEPCWGWAHNWAYGGWGPGWGSGMTTTTVQMDYDGVLVVDIVDAHQQKLVFEGTSTQMVSSKPEKNTKKLAKAVAEVFGRDPPQP